MTKFFSSSLLFLLVFISSPLLLSFSSFSSLLFCLVLSSLLPHSLSLYNVSLFSFCAFLLYFLSFFGFYDSFVQMNWLCLLLAVCLAAPPHYGNPANGCRSDEIELKVSGIGGSVCGTSCDFSACPQDVPANVTATPKCALSTGLDNFCALICDPTKKQYGAASCKPIGDDEGVCTYP